ARRATCPRRAGATARARGVLAPAPRRCPPASSGDPPASRSARDRVSRRRQAGDRVPARPCPTYGRSERPRARARAPDPPRPSPAPAPQPAAVPRIDELATHGRRPLPGDVVLLSVLLEETELVVLDRRHDCET